VIVVDASVAVKWLLPEVGDATARQLLSTGDRLFGPSLIRVEVAAAFARKACLREIAVKDAETAADLWLQSIVDGAIALVPEEAYLPRAVGLAIVLNHPLQDCLYLALAERLDAPLVTADEKFAAKVRPSHPRVRLLGESPPPSR
jgi:predicted nucleic acid-binding protein